MPAFNLLPKAAPSALTEEKEDETFASKNKMKP